VKIRADRAELSDAVTWVAQAISKKPAVLALSGMKIKAEGDTLTLSAFDYDISHSATITVEVQAEGECLVSGNFVREIVGALKGSEVELVLDAGHLTIQAGRSSYRAQPMRMEDYPNLPKFPAQIGEIHADHLAAMIATVRHAASEGSPSPQLNGIHIEGDPAELRLVGLGQHEAAIVSCPWQGNSETVCTVPGRALDTAAKGLDGDVVVAYSNGMLGLSDGQREVTLRCFAIDFADWRRFVMRDRATEKHFATLDPADLRDVLKRVGLIVKDEPVALALTPGEIGVSAITDGSDGTESIDAETDAEIAFGVNPGYLVDALSAVPSGRVEFGLIDPKRFVTIRPLDHPRMTFIVMPKRLPEARA
jgi:DNA polymerase-3 subunit beta